MTKLLGSAAVSGLFGFAERKALVSLAGTTRLLPPVAVTLLTCSGGMHHSADKSL